ncbi:MAG: hypothetical protein RI964_2017 [Pseudomonadota bacterium]|jgi:3',5'-cyclic AMP phosphodiesterase CpdA
MQLVHISDLHFGREQPVVLRALLQTLQQLQPNVVVISGDLTQRAKTSEYRAARAFLQALSMPYLIIPGNHDMAAWRVWERFCYPWRKWRHYVNANLQPVVSGADFVAVGVNTARRMQAAWDWSRGCINATQVAETCESFAEATGDTLRLVVAHHPFWLPLDSLHRGVIGGGQAALNAFQQSSVDIILGGHVHQAYMQVVQGMIISHAGTTFSRRLLPGQPNSFNVIRGDRARLTLQRWAWQGQCFVGVDEQHFQREVQGWVADDVGFAG